MSVTNPVELSVVVPVFNEAGNIPPLVAEIAAALCGRMAFEIVYVDDASSDRSVEALRALQTGHANLRILCHAERCGQSAALHSGVKAARGRWIATLDGDGQNDPADIPKLIAKRDAIDPALASQANARLLLAGERVARQDVWSKRIASRWANRLRQKLLHDHTPDTGCGLKLFPRALYLDLPYFDHMHRYLGALTLRQGGQVVSVPVNHRPRLRGASKYGILDRALAGIGDLIGVMWLQRRGRIPHATEDGQ